MSAMLLPIHVSTMFMFTLFRNTAWSNEHQLFTAEPINGVFYGQEPPSTVIYMWHDQDIGDEVFIIQIGPRE